MRRWFWRALLWLLLMVWLLAVVRESTKRLPPGVHIVGAWASVAANDVRFLRDQAAADAGGQPLVEQQIQSQLLQMIAKAQSFVLLDTGLFGDLPAAGPGAAKLRRAQPLATELSDALLRRKHEQPGLQVLLIVDPASLLLGDARKQLQRLRAAGIESIAVDLDRLRDTNAAFAISWRFCCAWWSGNALDGGWPNPAGVGPTTVSLAVWAHVHAFQRSHRQLLLADDGAGELAGLIFSRSLHAEAGIHTATALGLDGAALEPLLEAEFVVAQFSGWTDRLNMQSRAGRLLEQRVVAQRTAATVAPEAARARVLAEGGIAGALLARIDATARGDAIDIAALYLSQRELVQALIEAGWRGVAVRVLLDPGRDGYGSEHSGVPNRQVASELIAASDGAVRVRWYRTHGEQFSAGLVAIRNATHAWLLVGTAELGRRDLDDLNLAAAFVAELPLAAPAAAESLNWFDTLWYNRAPVGTEYTVDADVYADASPARYWQYRLLEASGASF